MKRVLVAEDEAAIREFVVINLKRGGYEVTEAADGLEALQLYEQKNGDFDIAVLDIMMPNMDGLELCKELRKKDQSLGIIMLTAKTQEMDKVTGLMVGADDYITKPFSPSELMARVDAAYRWVSMVKGSAKEQSAITLSEFTLDKKSHTLTKNGTPIDLTQVEFLIMEYFFENPNTTLHRSDILKKVWGENYYGEEKIVDVNIRRLRVKVEDTPSAPKHLMTIWGIGYKWIA